MADTKFKVTIITPDGTVYDNDNATMVIMNTSGGQMGIMAKHVPVLASLTISELRIKHDQGTDEIAAVNGGIMQFDGETALITADSAEMPKRSTLLVLKKLSNVLKKQLGKRRKRTDKMILLVLRFI